MAATGDPYRILGLKPGAPIAEIKRAYRRLAKEYHPDSAGEAALSRFLAIQAAYEALVAGGGPASAGAGRQGEPGSRKSWQAEPDRARATWEAYRRGRRTGDRAGRTAEEEAGRSAAGRAEPRGGERTGERAEPRAGAGSTSAGTAGAGPTGAGRTGERAEPRAGERAEPRAGGARRTGERGSDRTSRGGDTDRERRRATLGSTSYDEAEEEPVGGWEGATWYGTSSGTYWTINPKEYADPRKHGPEYQERARRRSRRTGEQAEPGAASTDFEDEPEGEAATDTGQEVGEGADPRATQAARAASETDAGHAEAIWSTHASRGASEPVQSADGDVRRQSHDRAKATGEVPPKPPSARSGSSSRSASTPLASNPDLVRAVSERLVLALIGWPPLGFALATLLGEASGCGRYSASCSDGLGLDAWLAQLGVIAILVALPAFAALSAAGSVFVLAAAVPAAVLLTAFRGAATASGDAAALLVVVLGVAYLVGFGLAASGRFRVTSLIGQRGSERPLP